MLHSRLELESVELIHLFLKRFWQNPDVNRLKQLEGQCENTFTNMSAIRFRA